MRAELQRWRDDHAAAVARHSARLAERFDSDRERDHFAVIAKEAAPAAEEFTRAASSKAVRLGTHRERSLDQTVRLAEAQLDLVGVSRIAEISGLDVLGLPVYNSIRPLADAANLTVTCGKGLSDQAALASAMMEAIERHSGERADRCGVYGTRAEVQALARVLHPTRLVLDRKHDWSESSRLEWWPCRDLVRGDIVLVPAAAVFTPYKLPPKLIGGFSDGLAAGNSLTEAVLHGLYELIERDSTSLGEASRTGLRIRPDSLPDEVQPLLEVLTSHGIEYLVMCFESEFTVPTFFVYLDDHRARDPWLINGGAGCHLDPAVAVLRAFTEAIQSRASVVSGGREDLARMAMTRSEYPAATAMLDHWRALPADTALADFPDLSTDSTAGDLRRVLRLLTDGGCPAVLATALTRAPMPFAVCRAVVPGMEFHREEPGRLGQRLLTRMLAVRESGRESGRESVRGSTA
jgi:ribosomal protein S12 methylthiotransferase accessory factor